LSLGKAEDGAAIQKLDGEAKEQEGWG